MCAGEGRVAAPRLLGFDSRCLDDSSPLDDSRLEESFKRLRSCTLLFDRSHAEFAKTADQRRILEGTLERCDQRVYDGLWRSAGCIEAVPRRDVECGKASLGRGRHTRQCRDALLAGDRIALD